MSAHVTRAFVEAAASSDGGFTQVEVGLCETLLHFATLLEALIAKIDKCAPAWDGAIINAAIHGYHLGPADNIKIEFEKASAALREFNGEAKERTKMMANATDEADAASKCTCQNGTAIPADGQPCQLHGWWAWPVAKTADEECGYVFSDGKSRCAFKRPCPRHP